MIDFYTDVSQIKKPDLNESTEYYAMVNLARYMINCCYFVNNKEES